MLRLTRNAFICWRTDRCAPPTNIFSLKLAISTRCGIPRRGHAGMVGDLGRRPVNLPRREWAAGATYHRNRVVGGRSRTRLVTRRGGTGAATCSKTALC